MSRTPVAKEGHDGAGNCAPRDRSVVSPGAPKLVVSGEPTLCIALRRLLLRMAFVALHDLLLRRLAFDARQKALFQPGPTLFESFDVGLETTERVDDLAVFLTKRIEVLVSRDKVAHGLFVFRELCKQ